MMLVKKASINGSAEIINSLQCFYSGELKMSTLEVSGILVFVSVVFRI